MRTSISIIALSIAAAGGLAAPAKAAPKASGQVKYCLTAEPLTGSRIQERECRTKAEWAQRGVDVDQLRRK